MKNRKHEIVDEINALLWEREDLSPVSPDMALDYRRDDGLPEPTPEERAQMVAEAARRLTGQMRLTPLWARCVRNMPR